MFASFSTKEVRDITISMLVLSLAFGIGFIQVAGPFAGFAIALFVVGLGFVTHEMAHRTVARRFGAVAEYYAYPFGLLLALLLAVATQGAFVFAAPGAVYVTPHKYGRWHRLPREITVEEYGAIAFVGPLVNIALAVVFLGVNLFFPSQIFHLAASVNGFLAFFNLFPVHPFDGGKVLMWDRKVWFLGFVAALIAWV